MKDKANSLNVSPRFSRPFALALVVAALIAFGPLPARANSTPALDFTGGFVAGAGEATLGWSFSLSSSVLVTDLGFWDANNTNPQGGAPGDGLAESHLVTIWTSSGVAVTSGMVPAGTSGTLVDDFRYLSIAPTLLLAGNYVIGAYYQAVTDALTATAATVTTASPVSYTGPRSAPGNVFPAGDYLNGPNSYFGPNFQFTTDLNGSAIPEGSSTWMLMLLGLTGTVGLNLLVQRRSVTN